MQISRDTTDKVFEAAQANIVGVVEDFVSLRKRGVNYLGNCPFHNEKTPSFTVSPVKGIYKCFGCGKGGNALNFIMDLEQLSYPEAIRYLAKKFHIHIEEVEQTPEQKQLIDERESMLQLNVFAQEFFIDKLHNSDEGKSVALSYFRNRGFRDDIIEKFNLGYSPEEKDALTSKALKNAFKQEFIEKTGLGIFRDNYKADRFRGRVIFPIHSLAGRPIGFGGRILSSEAKTAKYLNSPESDIYHKSKILYGIYQAKQEIAKQDKCYLVEGYTDVISMHQAGVSNVVASSGTALTTDQIKLVQRFTPNMTLIFDGDNAGIKASLRGIDLVLSEGMNVKVLLLPDGEDPDTFSKSMPSDALQEYIKKNEVDFINFKANLLLDDAKNDPVKRAQLLRNIVDSISVIPDNILRTEYIKECSVLLKTSEKIISNEVLKKQRGLQAQRYTNPAAKTKAQKQVAVQKPHNIRPFEIDEREILRYLMRYGHLSIFPEEHPDASNYNPTVGEFIISELDSDEVEFSNKLYAEALSLYKQNCEKEDFEAPKFFISIDNSELVQLASDLLQEIEISGLHENTGKKKISERDALAKIVPKVVLELKLKRVKYYMAQCRTKIKELQASGNRDEITKYFEMIGQYQKSLQSITKALGGHIIV